MVFTDNCAAQAGQASWCSTPHAKRTPLRWRCRAPHALEHALAHAAPPTGPSAPAYPTLPSLPTVLTLRATISSTLGPAVGRTKSTK